MRVVREAILGDFIRDLKPRQGYVIWRVGNSEPRGRGRPRKPVRLKQKEEGELSGDGASIRAEGLMVLVKASGFYCK